MSNPNALNIHVDQLLTNVSSKYRSTEYIADEVFPIVPVKKSSNIYRIYSRQFRLPETLADGRGLAREHDFNVSTGTYVLEKHKLKSYISDEDQENYDLSSLEVDHTEELTDTIMRRREKSVADLFTTTSWSLNLSLSSANAFSANTTTSNPIPVFDTAQSVVIFESGKKPNYGILPRDGFVATKNHVSVLDRTKYTSKEMTLAILAGLFDLPQLLQPLTSLDTSAEGTTETVGSLWGNDIAFVGFKPARPSPRTPSAGYLFEKKKQMVRKWRDEERESNAVEVRMKYQPKVVSSLSGFLIKGTVT